MVAAFLLLLVIVFDGSWIALVVLGTYVIGIEFVYQYVNESEWRTERLWAGFGCSFFRWFGSK